MVGHSDRVVVLATGSGLKDVASVMRSVSAADNEPLRIEPSLAALTDALKGSP
jgi:threonine synthase